MSGLTLREAAAMLERSRRSRPKRRRSLCWIYFIQAESGPIKIGQTHQEPRERLRSLQSANPERLTLLCAYRDLEGGENQLHEKYRAQRLHGEWFRPTSELFDEIAELSEDVWMP